MVDPKQAPKAVVCCTPRGPLRESEMLPVPSAWLMTSWAFFPSTLHLYFFKRYGGAKPPCVVNRGDRDGQFVRLPEAAAVPPL